jgi:Uri superfamily endonuclease
MLEQVAGLVDGLSCQLAKSAALLARGSHRPSKRVFGRTFGRGLIDALEDSDAIEWQPVHGSQVADALDPRKGTYLVLLHAPVTGRVRIGRLGELDLSGGVLVYAGSALGPGGVGARCTHHRRISLRPRWHLDYLRPECRMLGIWASFGRERLEHRWARGLVAWPGAELPIAGFGASDCHCPAHLVRLPTPPTVMLLRRLPGADRGLWLGGRPGELE